jgi:hypothetical protein
VCALSKEEIMMYSEKLAVAVKSNGKVLREFKDTVYVPFGSEYSILIKNLNSVRARVRISVDGTDATEDVWLIIDKNDELELERFIKGGNLSEGNRFKFIERTAKVEQHRGVKIDDGLIRIEFEFETLPTLIREPVWEAKLGGVNTPSWKSMIGGQPGDSTWSSGLTSAVAYSTNARSLSASSGDYTIGQMSVTNCAAPVSEAGITVPGSVSDQKFSTTYRFASNGQNHSMVIRMLGETEEGTPVVKPVTVKAKPKCVTCGTVNKATAKFCTECGTGLKIIDAPEHSPAFVEAYSFGWAAAKSNCTFPSAFSNSFNADGYTQGYRDARGKKKRLYK